MVSLDGHGIVPIWEALSIALESGRSLVLDTDGIMPSIRLSDLYDPDALDFTAEEKEAALAQHRAQRRTASGSHDVTSRVRRQTASNPDGTPMPRWAQAAWLAGFFGVIVGGIVLLLFAFSGSNSGSANSACSELQATAHKEIGAAQTFVGGGADAVGAVAARAYANTILDNPTCFNSAQHDNAEQVLGGLQGAGY